MIGRAPMFTPVYAPAMPMETYQPTFANAPAWNGRPPSPANIPPACQPPAAMPAPRFRGQSPEEPRTEIRTSRPESRPAYIHMPSPQQLGLAQAKPAAPSVNWSEVHQQLDTLGAIGVQREHLSAGSYRVSCLLPTAQPDRRHRIEVEADSEGEAVRLVLEKAQTWATQNRAR